MQKPQYNFLYILMKTDRSETLNDFGSGEATSLFVGLLKSLGNLFNAK